jgi:hypothetical protein
MGVADGGIGVAVGSGVEDGVGLVAVGVGEGWGEGVAVGGDISVGAGLGDGVLVDVVVGHGVDETRTRAVGAGDRSGVQLARTSDSSATTAKAQRGFRMFRRNLQGSARCTCSRAWGADAV